MGSLPLPLPFRVLEFYPGFGSDSCLLQFHQSERRKVTRTIQDLRNMRNCCSLFCNDIAIHLTERKTQSFSFLLSFPPKLVPGESVHSMHSEENYWKNPQAHRKIQVGSELRISKTVICEVRSGCFGFDMAGSQKPSKMESAQMFWKPVLVADCPHREKVSL